MKRFRQILFWAHLAAGLVAGLCIGIMCFTGAVIAFQSEIEAWSERDVRRVIPPSPEAARLPLDDLLGKVRENQSDVRPSSIVLVPDRTAAVAFLFGRDNAIYANPYTGELRTPISPNRVHDFLHTMEDWHRVLALSGDNRAIGKAINGACNLAFCFLAISGLYLWMPRTWSWRGVKAIAMFNFEFRGKARDFNWHNVIGLWCAPIFVVLTLTAIPISYRWGGNLIIRLSGETLPAVSPGPAGSPPTATVAIPAPAPGSSPIGYESLAAAVQKALPQWQSISFRLAAPSVRGGQRPADGSGSAPLSAATRPNQNATATPIVADPRRELVATRPERGANGGQQPESGRPREGIEGPMKPQAVTVVVKEAGTWPRTATTTLSLNPFSGEILKREGYADLPTSRQIRSWTRFLHTGQALGWPGQLIAGLACLGGCFLVYTGVALSWRRFISNRKADPAS